MEIISSFFILNHDEFCLIQSLSLLHLYTNYFYSKPPFGSSIYLNRGRFKDYSCCESDNLFKWRVTCDYTNSLFDVRQIMNKINPRKKFICSANVITNWNEMEYPCIRLTIFLIVAGQTKQSFTISDFLIPISLQPNVFRLQKFQTAKFECLKY